MHKTLLLWYICFAKMPKIILHQIDGSPPSRAVLMVKELLGLEMDIKEVNTIAGEQFKPEYLAKNPIHTVPLIEDGDLILADSHAIITYLVSKYGADKRAQLYPSDLNARAIIDQRMYFEASIVFPMFRAIMGSILKDKAKRPSEDHIKQTEKVYEYLETYLEASQFLASKHITLADISAVATVTTLHLLVPINEKFVKVHQWLEQLSNKDWYQKGNLPGLTRIGDFMKQFLEMKAA